MKGGWLAAAAAATLAACGSGLTAPGDDAEYDFAFQDPAGDTVVAAANPGLVKATDLLEVAGRVDRDRLTLTLRFAEPVTRWTAGQPNALDGLVLIDADSNVSTGFVNSSHGLGVDFYLDLRDDGFGRLAVVNVAKQRFERAEVQFEDATVTITVPRNLLTTDTDVDARFRLAVDIASRGRRPDVDASPTTGFHRLEPAP